MPLRLIRPSLLALAFVAGAPPGVGGEYIAKRNAPPTRVVGYLASWGVRTKGTSIANLPARHLTHIFYAFADIASDGSVTLGNRCVDVGACGRGAALPCELAATFANWSY